MESYVEWWVEDMYDSLKFEDKKGAIKCRNEWNKHDIDKGRQPTTRAIKKTCEVIEEIT